MIDYLSGQDVSPNLWSRVHLPTVSFNFDRSDDLRAIKSGHSDNDVDAI